MNKSALLIVIFSISYFASTKAISFNAGSAVHSPEFSQPDSIINAQILYNGRIWRNVNYLVIGDPYLFSNAFLTGSLTISGKTFSPLRLKYNLFEDEIHIPTPSGVVLQLNKEMVDSFSLSYENRIYRFLAIPEDSVAGLKGYVQVLYRGGMDLFIKYAKKIKRSDYESRPDKYYEITRVYCVQDRRALLIQGKSDLFSLSKDKKSQVKDFMRKNKVHVSKKNPESFIPVVRYIDSIN
jgi:hypothetical protein